MSDEQNTPTDDPEDMAYDITINMRISESLYNDILRITEICELDDPSTVFSHGAELFVKLAQAAFERGRKPVLHDLVQGELIEFEFKPFNTASANGLKEIQKNTPAPMPPKSQKPSHLKAVK